MSSRWCWRDAKRCLGLLREHPTDRRNLLLLARLPLAPPRLLQRLEGLAGSASVYRSLARLRENGLVAAWRFPLSHGPTPSLYFPTDLGLATTALDQGIAVRDLVRRNRLQTADLIRLVPSLPQHLAVYELLGILAASHTGHPNLLGWEKGWRRRAETGGRNRTSSVALPAYAELAWEDVCHDFLLLPDLGTYPLRLYTPTLRRLRALRSEHDDNLPILVVATANIGRERLWRAMIEETTQSDQAFSFSVHVTTWKTASQSLAFVGGTASSPIASRTVRAKQTSPLTFRSSSRDWKVPHFVEDDLRRSLPRTKGAKLGLAAAHLTPADHRILALVGHHPFLPIDAIADVLGWTPCSVRKSYQGLVDLGLARFVESVEINTTEGKVELPELTRDGLRLVASWQGLSLAEAIRENGLVGGGPQDTAGNRRQLLANLSHTLGVDRVFVAMIVAARRRGGALIEWRNASACARRRVRPDGYGVYAHGNERHGFFLEYDRGTMGERALQAKLSAYRDYLASGRYRRDYVGFPTILVVATDNAAEERFARVAAASANQLREQARLQLTVEWRIFASRENPLDPFGEVWRVPGADFRTRRLWPLKEPNLAQV